MTAPYRPGVRRMAAVLAGVSAVCVLAGGFALTSVANAAFVDAPVTGAQGRLVLSSDPYPAEFLGLSPGDHAYWLVDARLEDAQRATLRLEVRRSGELVSHPRGLTMTVDACALPWTPTDAAPQCPAGERRVTVRTPADDDSVSSPVFDLAPLAPEAPAHLLVTLGVEDSPEAAADESLMGLTGQKGLGLTAVSIDGEAVPPAQGGALPRTGLMLGILPVVAAIAAGLLGLGLALRGSQKGER